MSSRRGAIYAVDTSVMIAWLQGSPRTPDANLDAFARILGDVALENASLVVSTILIFELSGTRRPQAQADAVSRFLDMPGVFVEDVTREIAENAARIRDAVEVGRFPKNTRKLARNDGLILSTAVSFPADFLLTLDRGLLRLDGIEAVSRLRIVGPCDASVGQAPARPDESDSDTP